MLKGQVIVALFAPGGLSNSYDSACKPYLGAPLLLTVYKYPTYRVFFVLFCFAVVVAVLVVVLALFFVTGRPLTSFPLRLSCTEPAWLFVCVCVCGRGGAVATKANKQTKSKQCCRLRGQI